MSNLSLRQLIAPTSAAALVLLIGATPAAARPDAGAPVTTAAAASATSTDTGRCPLERVGTQLVRCDNLTGNGVAAPGWVTARSSATSTTAATASASTTTSEDLGTKSTRRGI